LRDDDAAFPSLDACPHPTALFEVLGARVDGVQGRRLGLAPVRNEAPSHRVHDECRLLRLGATNDGGMGARRNVVAGYIAVPVHPLVNAKCGITVELFNLVSLVLEMRIFREK
jgi:hypothetical protein